MEKQFGNPCQDAMPAPETSPDRDGSSGFTLVETLIALIILTFGLLAAGQMIYVTLGSMSLARSKGSAANVAKDRIEFLADLYRQNPDDANLTLGAHGPLQVQITNPDDNSVMNRFNVAWTVRNVADPRPGKIIKAKQVMVTVTPIGVGTTVNNKAFLNKVVNMTAIYSARGQ